MNVEAERFYDMMRRSGVDEFSARGAADNCARALDAARLQGMIVGGAVTGVIAGLVGTPVSAMPAAVLGGAAGAYLKGQAAWRSEHCEQARETARTMSGVGMDPYDILAFPIR